MSISFTFFFFLPDLRAEVEPDFAPGWAAFLCDIMYIIMSNFLSMLHDSDSFYWCDSYRIRRWHVVTVQSRLGRRYGKRLFYFSDLVMEFKRWSTTPVKLSYSFNKIMVRIPCLSLFNTFFTNVESTWLHGWGDWLWGLIFWLLEKKIGLIC